VVILSTFLSRRDTFERYHEEHDSPSQALPYDVQAAGDTLSPRKSWRERIKEWFSRRKRYNQSKVGD